MVTKVKYLGIYVSKKNTKSFNNNYEKLIENLKKDLQVWNKLKLSLLGRITVIKMTILPRFMFLFQALPIVHKVSILDKWQKMLINFVWEGKRARIKPKALCDLKENGGLQLPNIRLYFEADGL